MLGSRDLVLQRREHLVDKFAVLIVVVQAQRQHASGAGVMHQNAGDFFQLASDAL